MSNRLRIEGGKTQQHIPVPLRDLGQSLRQLFNRHITRIKYLEETANSFAGSVELATQIIERTLLRCPCRTHQFLDLFGSEPYVDEQPGDFLVVCLDTGWKMEKKAPGTAA